MHLAKLIALILQDRKQRILRTELKPVGVFVNALKRSLIINDDRRDLPVIDVRLLFDKYQVAVKDMRVYWRVKIDQAQERIFGPDYLHWQERYSYWDERDTY